jgi:arabinofuranan 3-O-arabinosyltransferase
MADAEEAAPRRRWAGVAAHVFLAVVAYVPLLRTQRGMVGADTKQYLYLDPGRLMERAASVWDPATSMGTVTHQNIGYLWPMGPWYRFWEAVGAPDWVAQRLWLGTVFFAAGAGVLYLFRRFGMRGAGPMVAALAYMLSPYTLAYDARISALLLPWAGLGWMLGLTILALRRGGWRYPALLALVVTTVGSINASALLFAVLAVALWVPFAIWYLGESDRGAALRTLGRIGVLTFVTQLWWFVALVISSKWGPPVLQTSETVQTVSTSSLASEVARSLGNWFFYGRDALGPWVEASLPYTQQAWLILLSFLLPVIAVVSAFVVRWRYRAYFVVLIALGAVIGVAAFPYDHPSPLGGAYKTLAGSSTLALALRNAQRAVPLLALGVAVLLGVLVDAVGRRVPRGSQLAGVGLGVLVLLNFPPLWERTLVDRNLHRPEELPTSVTEAAAWLDSHHTDTRVLEVPGADFAAQRWGNTVDPVFPGLISRPWVGRQSAPEGTAPSINLLRSLDRRLQEGSFEPASLAPIASLMSAGDVLGRFDLQTERYRTPRPEALWAQLRSAKGLRPPVTFGPPTPNVPGPELPLIDELALATPPSAETPPPIAAFPVADARPLVRAETQDGPVIVAGDGDGLVDMAAAGLLASARPVFYSGSLHGERSLLDRLLARDATLVVTDSNRRRAERFTTLRENLGYTEQAGEKPLKHDPSDARIDLFPGAGDDARTVTEVRGVRSVRATGYGNIVTYTPENRATLALDGDPTTAWVVGAFESPVGERLVIDLARPLRIDHLDLTQPLTGPRDRWITRARIGFDKGDDLTATLGDASRKGGGQRVAFSPRTVTRIEITVEADNIGKKATYDGLSPVGFAEVGIPGVQAREIVRLPTDLLRMAGTRAASHDLVVVLSRERVNPGELVRSDPERSMARTFSLPAARGFDLEGTVRLSADAPDDVVDRLLGIPDATQGGVTVTSTDHLAGDLESRASAAVDGDPATAWQTPFVGVTGQSVTVTLPQATTIDHLDLVVRADGRHSVPTGVRVANERGESRLVALPQVADGDVKDATAAAPIRFDPLSGTAFTVTVDAIRPVTTIDYYSHAPIVMPAAIAELGIPGVVRPAPPQFVPATCRTDLVQIDGKPVPVQLGGETSAAVRRRGLPLTRCEPSPLRLAAGRRDVITAPGATTGVDVDRLVLGSSPDRGAPAPSGRRARPPKVTFHDTSRSSLQARITGATEPFWLVLGQSQSDAWKAQVKGGPSLGTSTLIDGYANGWWIDPTSLRHSGSTITVDLSWTPQRLEVAALWLSLAGVIACLVLALWPRRRPAAVTPAPATAGSLLPDVPELGPPWFTQHAALDPSQVVTVSLVAGLSGALVIGWLAGPVVATVVLVALLAPRGRTILAVASAGLLAAAGVFTAVRQIQHGYPPGFTWAANFDVAHPLAWLALAFLTADVAVELLLLREAWRIRRRRPPPPATD